MQERSFLSLYPLQIRNLGRQEADGRELLPDTDNRLLKLVEILRAQADDTAGHRIVQRGVVWDGREERGHPGVR